MTWSWQEFVKQTISNCLIIGEKWREDNGIDGDDYNAVQKIDAYYVEMDVFFDEK